MFGRKDGGLLLQNVRQCLRCLSPFGHRTFSEGVSLHQSVFVGKYEVKWAFRKSSLNFVKCGEREAHCLQTLLLAQSPLYSNLFCVQLDEAICARAKTTAIPRRCELLVETQCSWCSSISCCCNVSLVEEELVHLDNFLFGQVSKL